MIPIDFDYYLPSSISEAILAYNEVKNANKTPIYYAGGSEIITMSKMASITFDAVIDLKAIPECQELKIKDNKLIIGSCASLTRIKESKLFPLLGTTVGRIADHTNQTRITIGGNICGSIIYKEAVLPLLLADSDITICSYDGVKTINIKDIFNEFLRLNSGEFISQISLDKKFCNAKYFHIKKTVSDKIDYPLITVCALIIDKKIRIAFSGLCKFPFRSTNIENTLNNISLSQKEKIDIVLSQIPSEILDNIDGSFKYRLFVLKNILTNILDSI